MLPERDATALEDMLAYAREAAQAARRRQREELDTDRFFYLGLQRLIEIIGEAAGRVSGETREVEILDRRAKRADARTVAQGRHTLELRRMARSAA